MKLLPAERLVLLGSIAVIVLNFALQFYKVIPSSIEHHALALVPAVILLAIGQWLRRHEATRCLALVFHVLALSFFVAPQGANLIFLSLPAHMAPVDATLVWLDSLFGVSWPALCAWLAQFPLLNEIVRTIYVATVPAMLVCLLFLAWQGDEKQLGLGQLSVAIGLLLTIVCWIIFPSAGASSYWQLDPAVDAAIRPVVDSEHGAMIVRLMRDGVPELGVMDMGGMVGFPSYHTALGIFILLCLWTRPLLRMIALALAPILAFGILTHGGHTLMDLLGGCVVAAISWRLSQQILQSSAKQAFAHAEPAHAG